MQKTITLYLSIDVPRTTTVAEVIDHLSSIGPVTHHRAPFESILDQSADQWAIAVADSHGVQIVLTDTADDSRGYRWSRGESKDNSAYTTEADAARGAIQALKLHAIACKRDQQGVTALPSHPLGSHTPHWTADHSLEAMREGWDIYQVHSDAGPEWQVQQIDDHSQVQMRHGIEPRHLKDDSEAWELIYNGAGNHHAAARAFLEAHSTQEWAAIVKVGWRRSQHRNGGL